MEIDRNRPGKSVTAMANFGLYDGFRFGIYSADLEERAHVHVKRENREVKFWLLPVVALFRPKGKRCQFTPEEIRDCMEIIEQHKQEFLDKFYREREISGRMHSPPEKGKSPSGKKKGCAVSPIIRNHLPIVEDFLRVLPEECIDGVCRDDDEKGFTITFFPNEDGIEPYLEICWFTRYEHQHVRLEIGRTEDGRYECLFEYEDFVTPENRERILQKILKYVLHVYSGAEIGRRSRIRRIL